MATTRHRSARLWVAAGFGIAVASVLLSISFAQPAQGKRLDDREPSALAHVQTADTLRPEFADIIEAVEPSVVTIAVEATIQGPQRLSFPPGSGMDEFFERFFGRQFTVPDMPQQQVHGVGSGFVIDRDGLIVTNNHVIDGAKHIVVTLHDGTEHDAKVIGADPKTDLALLEIDADGLTAARFGDSDRARVGDWVVAIGNPFGFGGTATVGIISARGRDLQSGPYDDFLQIDAPINRGNSGGPVFNTYGEVIGVNTAIYSPNGGNVGIGFAIPARQAEHVVGELRENGSVDRGWLGVQLQPMNAELAESFGLDEQKGALVTEVVPGSPADEGGIQIGDVIIEFNGRDVESARDLSHLVGAAESHEDVTLEVWRDGKPKSLEVTLGRMDTPVEIGQSKASDEGLGLALSSLDDGVRSQLGLPDDVEGAVVARVEPGSEAARQGLQPGDLVVGVDRRAVDSPKDVKRAIERARDEGRKSVVLLLRRGDTQRFAPLPIG